MFRNTKCSALSRGMWLAGSVRMYLPRLRASCLRQRAFLKEPASALLLFNYPTCSDAVCPALPCAIGNPRIHRLKLPAKFNALISLLHPGDGTQQRKTRSFSVAFRRDLLNDRHTFVGWLWSGENLGRDFRLCWLIGIVAPLLHPLAEAPKRP